jgi:hypothetical protein
VQGPQPGQQADGRLAVPHPAAQPVMRLRDQPVLAPATEEGIDPGPVGEIRGHRPPGNPARDQVTDRFQHLTVAVALGLPAWPSSQDGVGNSGRTTAHSASVMSDGYRRTRSG